MLEGCGSEDADPEVGFKFSDDPDTGLVDAVGSAGPVVSHIQYAHPLEGEQRNGLGEV